MRIAATVMAGLAALSCLPFAQQAPRITREPEPTFHPLASSAALRLVERSVTSTYAVAYAVQGTFERTQVSGAWTTYQRPPQVRLDLSLAAADGRIEARSYVSPDGVTVCQMTGPPRCERTDEPFGGDASPSNLLSRRPQDFTVVERERLVLAEERTQCYLFRPNDGVNTPFREAFLCFADDGVPLMVDMALRDGSSFVLEGRIARRTVSEAELRPPGR